MTSGRIILVLCSLALLLLLTLTTVRGKDRRPSVTPGPNTRSLIDDINEFLDTGHGSKRFHRVADMLRFEQPYKGRAPVSMKIMQSKAGSKKKISCNVCTLAVNLGLGWLRLGFSRQTLMDRAVQLCTFLNVQKRHVCQGLVNAHVDLALYIVNLRSERQEPLKANEVCGLALYPECNLVDPGKKYDWALDLNFAGDKPPPIEFIDKDSDTSRESATVKPLKVLQLTDAHVDPFYEPGSNAECIEPTCCRLHGDNPKPATPAAAAGFWGDYRFCDTPMHAWVDLVKNAAQQHPDVDYIMFTGDTVDHAIWNTSVVGNHRVFTEVMREIRKQFPSVPILPIFGNHDPHPLNMYVARELQEVPEKFRTNWLFELAADIWDDWLPGIRDTVLEGGYYSYEIRPGLKVIALNNNFCYAYNWWLLHKNIDPSGQLNWLAQELLDAEQNNTKVHIMMHIPGTEYNCFVPWRKEYRKIINRFENTVVAQFHGHTHYDQFNIYFDSKNTSRPINVAFTGGSATTFTDVNPNYRVYYIDPETPYRVLDFDTWYYNLTEANLGGPDVPPRWQKLYTFSEAYGITNLEPEPMYQMVRRMAANATMQQLYYQHYVRKGDASLTTGCDKKCLRDMVCAIVTPDPTDKKKKCDLPKTDKKKP